MKVAIVSLSDVDTGIDLANALHERGAKVTYYVSRSHVERTAGDAHRPIERLHELGILDLGVGARTFSLTRMRDLGSYTIMKAIAQAIREDGVDVAHVVMGGGEIWTAVLACLLNDIPVASTMIVPRPNLGEFPPASVVLLANRLLAYGSDLVIVNGREDPSTVERQYQVPLEKIRYVPLGPRNVFLRWSRQIVLEEKGTVLFHGRMNKHKGLEYLIRAQPIVCRQIPDARFIVAGKGSELNRCRSLIFHPDRFTILDEYVRGEAVAELFQRCSVVVMPYLTACTSGVLMTAYVFGKPVVATRVGSLPEYIEECRTGLLVTPRNEDELAEAIVRLLTDRDLREQYGRNAAACVQEQYSWKTLASKTIAAYEAAIELHGT